MSFSPFSFASLFFFSSSLCLSSVSTLAFAFGPSASLLLPSVFSSATASLSLFLPSPLPLRPSLLSRLPRLSSFESSPVRREAVPLLCSLPVPLPPTLRPRLLLFFLSSLASLPVRHEAVSPWLPLPAPLRPSLESRFPLLASLASFSEESASSSRSLCVLL